MPTGNKHFFIFMEYFAGHHSLAPQLKWVSTFVDIDCPKGLGFGQALGAENQLLNGIIQGDDSNQRIGQKVVLDSIELDVVIAASAWRVPSGSATPGYTRLVLLYDAQNNSATHNASIQTHELFDQLGSTSLYYTFMPYNIAGQDRFKVLMDRTVYTGGFALDSTFGFPLWATEKTERKIQLRRKLDLDVIFNEDNAGDGSDITTGGLYLWAMTDVSCIGPSTPTYSVNVYGASRIYFYDA